MRVIALTALLCVLAGSALAQGSSCKAEATEKKLAGAALTSFMKKCQTDAQKACNASAAGSGF